MLNNFDFLALVLIPSELQSELINPSWGENYLTPQYSPSDAHQLISGNLYPEIRGESINTNLAHSIGDIQVASQTEVQGVQQAALLFLFNVDILGQPGLSHRRGLRHFLCLFSREE